MKSYCIKTNNKQIVKYLLNRLNNLNFPDIYYSEKSFAKYDNIILHYKEKNIEKFNNIVSSMIADIVVNFYEEKILRRIINVNYFYFDANEKNIIYNNCEEYIYEKKEEIYESLFFNVKKYIETSRNIYLDGLVNFRIEDYVKDIDNIVDSSVNQYIIEKEYKEFISLLKVYINSSAPKEELIHLIYINGESILLDKDKNIIKISETVNGVQYLSDISFSTNDMALNTLLNILPKKIEVHIIDKEDEFVNTLKLIFEDKIRICNDCDICRTYRKGISQG